MSTEDSMMHDGVERGQTYGWGWPFWKVGSAILVAVLVILGSAFVLNGQFRSPVGLEPIATALPSSNEAAGNAPTAGASATLEQQVMDAYLRYWDIRKAAFLSLDASLLPQVMDGDALARDAKLLQDFKAQGNSVRADVDHNLVVVEITPTHATVYDEYLNRSVFLNAATGQELETTESPGIEKISYRLEKTNDVWKVVDSARHP